MIFPLRRTQKTPESRGWQRGQGNFGLVANFGYIHEGQLTLAKACVSAGSQSLSKRPQSATCPGFGILLMIEGKARFAPNVESGFDFTVSLIII